MSHANATIAVLTVMLTGAAAAAQTPLSGPVKDESPPLSGTKHVWVFENDLDERIQGLVIKTGSFVPENSFHYVAPPLIQSVATRWVGEFNGNVSPSGGGGGGTGLGTTEWSDDSIGAPPGSQIRVTVDFSRPFAPRHWIQFIPTVDLAPTQWTTEMAGVVGAVDPDGAGPDAAFAMLAIEQLARLAPEPPLRFLGFSSATTDGLQGVLHNTELCQQDFGGSRMCTTGEIFRTVRMAGLSTPGGAVQAWVHPGFDRLGALQRDFTGAEAPACGGWSTYYPNAFDDFYQHGMVVDSNGRFDTDDCQQQHPVACCGSPKQQ